MDSIRQLAAILQNSRNLVVFTGAGISVPSGIPDFRSANGLYNRENGLRRSPEEIISHSFFLRHPDEFYAFYRDAMLYPNAKPNAAHRFFAKLETADRTVSVVTQNIDGLHQAAGSSRVFELHGNVLRNLCMDCGARYGLQDILTDESVPHCPRCGGIIKPDVVLYEEPLDMRVVAGAVNAIEQADTLIVVGTSLVVYPAASYLQYFGGRHLILINKSKTDYDSRAELAFNDDVVNVVRELEELGVS